MRAMIRRGLDPQLVAAARDGDPAALDALIAQSLPLVYNIAGRALRGHADADDVVQETMLRVVRSLGALRDADAYRSWLAAITVRQVRDFLAERQAARSRAGLLDDPDEAPDPAGDFAELTILRLGLTDQRRDVVEATRWLGQDERELLSLWWLEESGELERAGLAGALGVTQAHAAVRVKRMKEHLDTARTVVRALRGSPRCASLGDVARSWDGTPDPLWRKRIARHVRECAECGGRSRGLVPVQRLLHGLPLVPLPVGYGAYLVSKVRAAAQGPAAGPSTQTTAIHTASAAHTPSIAPTAPTASAGHRAVRTARRGKGLRHRGYLGGGSKLTSVIAVATAAVVIVAGVAVAMHKPNPPQTPVDALQATQASVTTLPTPASPSPSITSASPSPSKASPSPSASQTKTTAPAVPAAPVTVTSSKKGVGVWSFDGADTALKDSGSSWYYSWSTGDSGVSAPGAQFVPMIWGSASVTSSALAQAKATGSPDLLGFNEPDNSGQSNMSASQALSLWPQLESTGMALGAPAVASGGATPGGWLDQFMAGAKSDGYRVDFIPLHWYGGDFDTTDAVSQLESYIESVYDRYHKPIWLTEFSLINFSGNGPEYPTEAQLAAFVTASIHMLDGLSYVQRYAWFGLPASGSSPTGLFDAGPVATEAGRAFETAR